MTDAATASPRPWRVTEYDPGPQDIYDANGFRVCAMGITTSSDADAALIVEAVNERDRLRKAFEDISEFAAGMTSEEDEANAFEILDICAKALEGME